MGEKYGPWLTCVLLLGAGAARAEVGVSTARQPQWLAPSAARVWDGLLSLPPSPDGWLLRSGGAQRGPRRVPFIGFRRSRYEFLLRPGYRQGLPIPEDAARLEESLELKSKGSLVMGAGTLPLLHVEVEGFRERLGARRYRYVAVPGLVLRPLPQLPVQLGASLVLGLRRPDAVSLERGKAVGVLQVCGRF